MTNTSFWRVCFVSQEFELWLQIARSLRMNSLVPHHKLPCGCSWGSFLPDIYQSVNLLFSFPLHHPILLEKGLISESACWSRGAACQGHLLAESWTLWHGFILKEGLSASPVAAASLTKWPRCKKLDIDWWWMEWTCWLKWGSFCFMDDLFDVLMCCLYNVKTNLHDSTASEACFSSSSQNLKRWEKWPDPSLVGGTAHKEY